MIVVRGHTLAGMAAAARLARLGHPVTLTGDPVRPRILDFFELPAAWRDLFKKSGRPLPGELIRLGAAVVAAPPTTHLLPDGTELVLPSSRGGQWTAIEHTFGRDQSENWRRLVDDLDDVWAALRRFGAEAPGRPEAADDRRALWLDRTITDVADRAGPLAPVVLAQAHFAGTDSRKAPGLVAAGLSVVRTFGRHQLIRDDAPLPGTTLTDLLTRRLEERGVRLAADDEADGEHELDCRPQLPRKWFRKPRPALAPRATEAEPGEEADLVDHTGDAPVRTLRTRARAVVLDYRDTSPGLAAGIAPDDARRWLMRPTPDATRASSASPAGGEPWAELLSGALAVYDLHERLTGEDARPTNVDFKLPRIHAPRTAT
ncbi:MAG: hypothetical protein GX596_14585 [Propionibacterium sp.]|nr:hypothetical protein [Propionibacterium sp.]